MYKYILWDNDGVLVDTEVMYYRATRRMFEELSLELDEATYHQYMVLGERCWEIAHRAGMSEEDINAAIEIRDGYYRELLENEDIEIPGVRQVLEELSTDHDMAIVTTANRDYFGWIHEGRNLVDYMEFVLTFEDYPRPKPAPDPYLHALERFNAAPHETVVIEDTERGLRSAAAAGIDCIIVESDFIRGHDFSMARHIIGSLAELPPILRQ
ncbi:MAG: HAD family phosphatase [Gammaproteobacteria bacterium]|jgi:HAD superfamily hydrolase (TIGR01509 family)